MNRIVLSGVAGFFALVGLCLVGTDNTAVAGHGCHGCNGAACDGGYDDCCGRRHRRHRRHRCCGEVQQCCGAPAPACCEVAHGPAYGGPVQGPGKGDYGPAQGPVQGPGKGDVGPAQAPGKGVGPEQGPIQGPPGKEAPAPAPAPAK